MVIETMSFRLRSGVGVDEFLAADRAAYAALAAGADGFIRRTTARGDDGSWLVVTLWRDAGSVVDAAGLAALVEEVDRRRYTTLD